jgi:integrase
MSKRSRSARPGKPAKPRPDFPLFPHATRRWAKKIRGKLHYFGPWEDPEGALNKYLDQKDDLHAGRRPRAHAGEVLVRDVLNHFLTAKKRLLDSGELTARTWGHYHGTCERIAAAFGRTRPVADLRADDFAELRAAVAKSWGPVALGAEIRRVRTVFKHAFDAGLFDAPVRFGPDFRMPNRKVLRQARAANGLRFFEAAVIRALLAAAGPQLKAMILLGVNCGYGNADCGKLPRSALDLEGGWANFPRPKTGVERRCALWPETVEALKAALARRPEPKDPAHAGLVFITHRGGRWFKPTTDNPVAHATRKLLMVVRRLVIHDGDGRAHTFYLPDADLSTPRGGPPKAEALQAGKTVVVRQGGATVQGKVVSCEALYRPGLNFYALRHTFETVGGEARDQVAVDAIMGHARHDMASVYREKISDERLKAVTDHVRAWLFGKPAAAVDKSASVPS